MRYALSHRTSYRYAATVDLAQHIAHLRPRRFPGQSVADCRLLVDPAPQVATLHVDHFGNQVDSFRVEQAHTELIIEMRSEVEVLLPVPTDPALTPPWESVSASLAAAFPAVPAAAEFTYASPLVAIGPEAAAYALPSFPAGRPVLAGALDLIRRIRADFTYTPGATDISTPLDEVFARRLGVCQDFAHVGIAVLRALGLAAGYVSGYIRTYPRPGGAELRGADASHAWIAVWCGPEAGWVHLDPTNDLIARDEHVIVAWGRDFSDVSPVRGMILGGGAHHYGVSVELRPVE
ncbi:transglutaminase family protein [Vineibacter terrae]|uniref:Transglutaminase family protein n=1 Tax=Vineibacter terrae TaxID=2586908 RepID=A0A5C8PAT6_9HYPH|nr:transglutaminase family protein [Vineibacter terrae]TXL70905.1 transglutaminase family protein [Vineibacter terrae]